MRHVCPACSSDYRQRVPAAGILQRIARMFGWHLYRCMDCGHRFWDRPTRRKAS
jgi:uncharacterized Zn finger protein